MCVKLNNNYTCLKLHLCIKYYYVFKITHFVSNYTLCVILHTFCKTAHFVQYQSSLFHVSIGKFYTWLNNFTQPAVVMVVTNMKYGSTCRHSAMSTGYAPATTSGSSSYRLKWRCSWYKTHGRRCWSSTRCIIECTTACPTRLNCQTDRSSIC